MLTGLIVYSFMRSDNFRRLLMLLVVTILPMQAKGATALAFGNIPLYLKTTVVETHNGQFSKYQVCLVEKGNEYCQFSLAAGWLTSAQVEELKTRLKRDREKFLKDEAIAAIDNALLALEGKFVRGENLVATVNAIQIEFYEREITRRSRVSNAAFWIYR